MKMAKTLITLTIAGAMLVFAVGCSGSSTSSSTAAATSQSSSAPAASSASTSATAFSSSSSSVAAEVKAPDVVGKGCDVAVEELKALGLDPEPISDSGKMVVDYSNWMVLDQNPAAGTTLKQGDTVRLKVTKGKADGADVAVPDVVGKNCGEATSDLEYLGLKVDVSSDNGKAVIDRTNWTVLEQKPAAGETAREGSVVELVVTKGEGDSAPAAEAPAAEETPAAEAPATAEPAESVPTEYKTALKKAEQYSELMHMSKQGIYDQLTSEYGEQYEADAAQYAVDNMTADWNANALEKARSYQEMMNMSPAAIYDQLTSEYGEQFTPEEAQYAIDNL